MTCDHCRNTTASTIMSMFNNDNICADCKEAERKRPDYKQAESADLLAYAQRLRGFGMSGQANNVEKLAKSLLEGE